MVLVTDAEVRAVVAACRALRAGGFRVTATATSRLAAAQWSRSCGGRLILPPPIDERPYVDALVAAVRRRSYALLMPGTDRALRAISIHRERLRPYVSVALPPHEVVMRCLDKVRLGEAAQAVGLSPPPSAVCLDVDEALSVAEDFSYPVMLKPRHVITSIHHTLKRPASSRVVTPKELAAAFPLYGKPCLVQRAVSGRVFSFAGVQAGGRLLATAMSRYDRTWRPNSGNVAYSTSIEAPPQLSDQVERLLQDLGWEGMFELELIAQNDGPLYAIDFNPRPYGSLALAVKAGANLPAAWAGWALGEDVEPVRARAGVHFRWEDADFRFMLWNLRRRRYRAAIAVLRPRRQVAHAYFRAADPGPFLARLIQATGIGKRTSAGTSR